jgi:DNA-binding winged helix-turn-helix (wHTH) protein/TolB-like protein/Flp pilus assembly protein TadD
MRDGDGKIYEFGHYSLNLTEKVLERDGVEVSLTPKAFEALVLLVENSGHLVGKDELLARIWPDTIVEEGNLSVIICRLRKALGADDHDQSYIQTVPKRGYRFVSEIKIPGSRREPAALPGSSAPTVIQAGQTDPLLQEPSGIDSALPASPVMESSDRRAGWLSHRPRWMSLLAGMLIAVIAATLFWLRMPDQGAVRSVVIMPFNTLSANPDDKHHGLSMTDALITRLNSARRLVIRPTSSITKYANTKADPLAVGREQGVDAVLDGSIQRSGDRVRVTVNLVRTNDGAPLWAAAYDERFTNLFAVEDAIVEKVASEMVRRLSESERAQLSKRPTENDEAYHAYRRGRFHWNQRNESGLLKAIEYFQQAIDKDPDYALAHVGQADSYALLDFYTVLKPQDSAPMAEKAATQALKLDDTLAEAHTSLAAIKTFFHWDWVGAEREFKRAIELDPNYSTAYGWAALNLIAQGRSAEAERAIKRALELDPLSPIINTNVGWIYYLSGRADQAIEQYRNALELDPNFARAHLRFGFAYAHKGMYEKSLAEFRRAFDLSGDPQALACTGYVHAAAGRRAEARRVLADLNERARRQYISPYGIALIHTGLGDKDRAFEWLEKAFQDRSSWLIYLKVEPLFASLQSDPRAADLLRRLNLTPDTGKSQ